MLNIDQIKERAPAAFSNNPIETASNKYSFIPTKNLITNFEKIGWRPTTAYQNYSCSSNAVKYAKHIITFAETDKNYDKYIPEVAIYNSHDRLTTLQIIATVVDRTTGYRSTISDTVFPSVKIKHRAYSFIEIKNIAINFIQAMPTITDKIDKYKTIILTHEQNIAFIQEAHLIKYQNGSIIGPFVFNDFVNHIDIVNNLNLWNLFQKAQILILRGGLSTGKFSRSKHPRKIKTRRIKSIREMIRITSGMWKLLDKTSEKFY